MMQQSRGGQGGGGDGSVLIGMQSSAHVSVKIGGGDRDQGERLLRFLSRLSRFGLAADGQPLLRPAKPGL